MFDERQWCHLGRRFDLTTREQEVARLICEGLRTTAVAEHLRIRPGTVKTHVRNIYRKMRVKDRINMLLRFVTEAAQYPSGGPDT